MPTREAAWGERTGRPPATAATKSVVLMYHEIERPGRPPVRPDEGYRRYVVTETQFRTHLDRLRQAGVAGLSVGEALAGRQPARAVVFSFDDGCETDLTLAAPLLGGCGFSATFYVVAGFVGRRGFLTAQQVRDLAGSGFEVGCHSMTHPFLTDLPDGRLSVELRASKDRLEQMIGGPVAHFSCPGGRWDRRVDRFAREAGYRSVATSRVGALAAATDPFCLPRVAVLRGTTLAEIDRMGRGRGLWRLRIKDLALTAAKRVAGSSLYESLRAAALGAGPAELRRTATPRSRSEPAVDI